MNIIGCTRKKIRRTETYKSAPLVIKRMLTNRTNAKAINTGLNVAKSIGFDMWNKMTKSKSKNRDIIYELLH